MIVQLPVVYGGWIMEDGIWRFEVDNRKGGRMFFLSDGFKHEELVEMAQDDYDIDKKSEVVELTYSLPPSMLQQMARDTPPMHVKNDRQVQSLIELSRTNVLRLCVSSRPVVDTGVAHADCEDDGSDKDVVESEDEDVDNDVGDKIEDDVKDEAFGGVDGVKEEDEPDSDDDYSEYGKVKDEDEEDTSFGVNANNFGVRGTSNPTWSDNIFVKQSFSTKDELLKELRLTALMLRFSFKVYKSTTTLFVAICGVKGCEWKVRASVKNEANRFWVTKYVNVHTCSTADRVAHRKHSTPKYIGHLFIERVGIINGITPDHIKDSMKTMFGMTLDYTTAYRALKYAQTLVRGSPEDGYRLLPSYLHHIAKANPGTVTGLEMDATNRFKYLFIAFGASIAGFKYLRRVIVVDGTHLSGKYEGTLLVAAAQDANFQIFPLAFGVVDSENNESWEWFFKKLRLCISDGYPLVIVSDRHQSIINACAKVFPWATRGICYYHLQCNIAQIFGGKDLMYLVKGAAYAYTEEAYDRYMDALRTASPGIAKYLEDADPKLWSRVHSEGLRYNIKTSNIAESINAALKVARGFPVAYLLDFIRIKLGRWFYKRRDDASKLTTRFSRGVEYLLAIRDHYAGPMTVERIDEYQFIVKGGTRNYLVDLLHKKCSCGIFQIERIPCSHAIAASIMSGADVATALCPSYGREYLYAAYYQNIFPKNDALPFPEVPCLPPEVQPKKGRKKKSRWQSYLELSRRKGTKPRKLHNPYKCSNCHQTGHTRPHCLS